MDTSPHPFYTLSQQETLGLLDADEHGLMPDAVLKRRERYGLNVLPEPKKITRSQLFFKQLKSFLLLILCAAAVLSVVLGDYSDAVIITLAIVINVIVGYIQEGKANRALDALRHVISAEATVVRNAVQERVDVRELVPGDILLVHAGDKISADARVIESIELEVNESILTGESTSVIKSTAALHASVGLGDRVNMVYTGTTVLRGSATVVVTDTGSATEIGRIAALLQDTPDQVTPLQKRLDQLARTIGIIVLGVCLLMTIVGLSSRLPFVEVLTTAVAVAVSAIPEGLAVAVTVILAVGMQRILKRNALVRNLQAAETLGATSVICTDKTGTLTEGHMQVVSVMTRDYHFTTLHKSAIEELEGLEELMFALTIAMQCNDAHVVEKEGALEEKLIIGNMTEQALLSAALSVGLEQDVCAQDEPRLATVPFDSSHKMMATLHQHPTAGKRMYIKGAPERLLKLCSQIRIGKHTAPFSAEERAQFERRFEEESAKGLRMLAVCYKDVPEHGDSLKSEHLYDAVFVGLLCLQDPLREGIAQVFERTQAAGIRTVVITGDHPITARAIAEQMGLHVGAHQILEGDQLQAMTQEELNATVEDILVYARVSPKDKLNIIRAWQSRGKVVAMTGDGVNDAPALKAANIGIALGSGTDVAKEAADMVLLDNQFSTIVAAVEEGRGIFDTIRKVVLYLLADSFSEVIVVTGALLMGWSVPLVAAQILWINLVSDGLPNIALTVDPKDDKNMSLPPRAPSEPVMSRQLLLMVGAISLFTGVWNLVLYYWIEKTTGDHQLASTIIFVNMAIDSLFYVFSVRSLHVPVWKSNPWNNPWLLLSVLAAFVIQCSALYFPPLQQLLGTVPLDIGAWGIVLGTSVTVVIVFEIIKVVFRPRRTVAHI